jgi:hypothetical protein
MVEKLKVRIQIRDEQPGSYFMELTNYLFGFQYLNSLMRIRDGKKSDPGSGKTSWIRNTAKQQLWQLERNEAQP